MNGPVLVMAASPGCVPGRYLVEGAKPPPDARAAYALVVPSLVPLEDPGLTDEQRSELAACLPPTGYVPEWTEVAGEPCRDGTETVRFFGFWFASAAINFVRAHHPFVRWSRGGADGSGPIGETDLLHGWVGGRCVAVVLRVTTVSEKEGEHHVG